MPPSGIAALYPRVPNRDVPACVAHYGAINKDALWRFGGDVVYKPGGMLTLLGCTVLAAAAFPIAEWWSQPGRYERILVEGCELHKGPCRRVIDGAPVVFSVVPQTLPLMQPLRLRVSADGLVPHGIQVEVRGLNMDMGLNRTRLARSVEGWWEGQTVLPVCSQRRMQWEAAVRIDASRRIELAFPFTTRRQ